MVKGYCHYHLCERKGEVEQCPHCKKHFCSEHINPIEPGSYHPEKSRVFVNQIRLGHEKTHPCPDYVDYLEQQKKIQGARWGRALDRLTGRTHKEEELEEDEGTVYQSKVSTEYKKQQRIDEKARLRAEKEKLAQEIEEKQRKHLKEQEKNEPYLYRYIPPEEKKSQQPPKVPEKYKKEHVGTANHHHETYKEETSKEKYHKREYSSIFSKLKINRKNLYVVGIIILLLLVGLFYATSAKTTIQETKNVSNTKTISSYENVSNKISFSEYLKDIYSSDKQKVTLNGFLERSIEGDGNAGVHVFSVVDDYNNKVILDWSYNELKKYLPDLGKTKELYSVQGVFKREYKTLKLNVENINSYKREPAKQVEVNNVVSYTEQIILNRTSPKYPLVRNLVFKLIGKEVICEDSTKIDSCSNEKPLYCSINGLKEEPAKCGCHSGKRLYKNRCINEVKCSDGTYEPECSKNKPKQCVDGKLVDNPETCGCPEFYKLKDKKCVYIKCSDGTIEPDCSAKLKMQCIEGTFVYNPNKCGCPDGYVKRGNNCVKTCSDGTAYDECSNDKPFYCEDGTLLKKPQVCGCNIGYQSYKGDCIDSNQVESMEATDYLNQIRKKYDRNPLKWDQKLYELAIYRTKDMYDRKYFDHVTPEGKCVQDFKGEYGLEDYNIAENAGAVTYDYSDTQNVAYASYANVKEQIDGWMESRGHRYNLLYPSHSLGVATCYKGACVFLGANKEYYGLGFGPCTTGAEGTAYWETVSKQSSEI